MLVQSLQMLDGVQDGWETLQIFLQRFMCLGLTAQTGLSDTNTHTHTHGRARQQSNDDASLKKCSLTRFLWRSCSMRDHSLSTGRFIGRAGQTFYINNTSRTWITAWIISHSCTVLRLPNGFSHGFICRLRLMTQQWAVKHHDEFM